MLAPCGLVAEQQSELPAEEPPGPAGALSSGGCGRAGVPVVRLGEDVLAAP